MASVNNPTSYNIGDLRIFSIENKKNPKFLTLTMSS